jgi:hypothetical protein
VLIANPSLISLPFYLAGGFKILYDLLLYRDFRSTAGAEASATPSASPRA